ncbi:hypothetical protein DLJ49_16750 [Rhodovulum sp. 12E13]|uniref:hypothetical protein n=1 Tax=Rhodovulum sp. 12E13 TaxID=2203891 RepID=UPI000E1311F9|nr:hypothetical protein [Rhodovulum sp. 12E13]RDC70947.1 hypothetical protein DLJ49_16750 [Rhodovulum sp. 12E13]
MITLDDIEDMTDLTRAEIEAIAEHEHMGEGDAALFGDYVMHIHHGPARVQQMICEDIRTSLRKDDLPHARTLFEVLRRFMAAHPDAARGASPN